MEYKHFIIKKKKACVLCCRRLPIYILVPTSKNNLEGQGWSCSHYRATGQPTRTPNYCRGVYKAREGSSKTSEFSSLLGNSYRVWAALSMPALTWLSRENTCSDANESPTCKSFRREHCRRSREIGIILLCRIKYLPKHQEVASQGQSLILKLGLYQGIVNIKTESLLTLRQFWLLRILQQPCLWKKIPKFDNMYYLSQYCRI